MKLNGIQTPSVALRPSGVKVQDAVVLSEEKKTETSETKDSFSKSIGKGLAATGERLELGLGGASSILGGMAGVYTGIVGGAVVGTLAGGAAGPIIGSIASEGIGGFLSTALATTGALGKAGMVLGGLTLGVGGWKAGDAVGSAIGKGMQALGGRLSGSSASKEADSDRKLTTFEKATGSVLMGGGALMGAAGGAILGSVAAGSFNLINAVATQGFTSGVLSTVTSHLGTAAAVGAGTMAVVGGVGGWQAVRATRTVIDEGMQQIENSKRWLTLEKKEKQLNVGEEKLVKAESSLAWSKQEVDTLEAKRREGMDQREAVVAEQNKQSAYKEDNAGRLIETEADRRFVDKKEALLGQDKKQQAEDKRLTSEEQRVTKLESNFEHHAETRTVAKLQQEKERLESTIAQLNKDIASLRKQLEQDEATLDTRVDEKVHRDLEPRRDDLRQSQDNKDRYERETDRARSEKIGYISQEHSERSRASRLESEESSVRSDVRRYESEVSSLESEVSSLESTKSRLASELRDKRNRQ